MRRRTAIVSLVAVLLLAGCSQGENVDENLTVDEAKAIAQEMEREIAALVPDEYVTDVVQNSTGTLMQCDTERGYQWAGSTRVYITDGLDVEAVVASASDEFGSRDGFRVEQDVTVDGEPSAHIIGDHGAGYLVERSVDGTYMDISSFSPCFRLPDGVSPRGDF